MNKKVFLGYSLSALQHAAEEMESMFAVVEFNDASKTPEFVEREMQIVKKQFPKIFTPILSTPEEDIPQVVLDLREMAFVRLVELFMTSDGDDGNETNTGDDDPYNLFGDGGWRNGSAH